MKRKTRQDKTKQNLFITHKLPTSPVDCWSLVKSWPTSLPRRIKSLFFNLNSFSTLSNSLARSFLSFCLYNWRMCITQFSNHHENQRASGKELAKSGKKEVKCLLVGWMKNIMMIEEVRPHFKLNCFQSNLFQVKQNIKLSSSTTELSWISCRLLLILWTSTVKLQTASGSCYLSLLRLLWLCISCFLWAVG